VHSLELPTSALEESSVYLMNEKCKHKGRNLQYRLRARVPQSYGHNRKGYDTAFHEHNNATAFLARVCTAFQIKHRKAETFASGAKLIPKV